MTWEYPWDFVRHIESRRARFALTPDRLQFRIIGTKVTADELAYIHANRDRILQHVQHLIPPPEFIRQRDLGWPGWKTQRKAMSNEADPNSRASEDRQVDVSKVPF
jgi:hypothetical protein